MAKALTSGAWNIVLPLGLALLVRESFAGEVRIYGLLLATYGAGNLAGALVLSNLEMERPMRMMGCGFLVLGLGFLGLALSPSLPYMLVFAALAAVGGPMNDLAHIDVIQKRYPPESLSRVVRFRMAVEFSGNTLALFSAPLLFRFFAPSAVVAFAGIVTAIVGAVGLARYHDL